MRVILALLIIFSGCIQSIDSPEGPNYIRIYLDGELIQNHSIEWSGPHRVMHMDGSAVDVMRLTMTPQIGQNPQLIGGTHFDIGSDWRIVRHIRDCSMCDEGPTTLPNEIQYGVAGIVAPFGLHGKDFVGERVHPLVNESAYQGKNTLQMTGVGLQENSPWFGAGRAGTYYYQGADPILFEGDGWRMELQLRDLEMPEMPAPRWDWPPLRPVEERMMLSSDLEYYWNDMEVATSAILDWFETQNSQCYVQIRPAIDVYDSSPLLGNKFLNTTQTTSMTLEVVNEDDSTSLMHPRLVRDVTGDRFELGFIQENYRSYQECGRSPGPQMTMLDLFEWNEGYLYQFENGTAKLDYAYYPQGSILNDGNMTAYAFYEMLESGGFSMYIKHAALFDSSTGMLVKLTHQYWEPFEQWELGADLERFAWLP